MSDQSSGPPGAPSWFAIGVIIIVVVVAFHLLPFASEIPTPSGNADEPKPFASKMPTPSGNADEPKTPAESADPSSGKFVRVGGRAVVTTPFAACKDRSSISKIKSLALEGDKEAAAEFAQQQSCTTLDVGDVGTVEDFSGWSGTTCIRKDGEPECYWFPTPFLDADDNANDERSDRRPSGYAAGGAYACAKIEDIRALYEAIKTGSSRPAEIFTKANQSCIQMGEGWSVFASDGTDDGYTRIESPGNFEGQLWTSSLSITSGHGD